MRGLVFAGWMFAAMAPGLVLAAAPIAADARYRVSAELKPVTRSAEGRYALSAEVRVVPQQASADGRYVLKSTNASCDPLDFSLFANGFET